MNIRKIQFIFSLVFILVYIALLITILYVEISDDVNTIKGENSMMGEIKILLGVLTAAIGQILNFWFNSSNESEKTETETEP